MSTSISGVETAQNFSISPIYNNIAEQGNTTQPFLYLDKNDYAVLIHLHKPFGERQNLTYIHLEAGAFHDYYNVPSVAEYSFMATSYVGDTLNPYIMEFSLNMNLGHLTVKFNEPVVGSGSSGLMFTLASVGIQAVDHIEYTIKNPNYVQLVDTNEQYLVNATDYNRLITVYIGSVNLNRIKQGSLIGRSVDTTWFSITAPIVSDTSGNPVALSGVDFYNAMPVTTFTPDTNKPYLLYWDYDVYYGQLKLHFSEVLKATSFNYTSLAVSSHNAASGSRSIYRLDSEADYRNRQVLDSDIIVVTFSVALYNSLLDTTSLLTGVSNSFVILDSGVAWDTSRYQNKYFDATTSLGDARQVSTFIPDTVKPMLTSVNLNMTSRTITFGFHKVVRSSSMVIATLTLQSERSSGEITEYLQFTSLYGSVVIPSSDSPFAKVLLTDKAFNRLKSLNYLASRRTMTFVAFSLDFIKDKAFVPNNVGSIPSSDAFAVTTYTPDYIPPYLTSWYMDMHDDQIVLVFSEPVSVDTLDVTSIRLYSDSETQLQSTFMVRLWEASIFEIDQNIVTLAISREESIAIKSSSPLCTQRITCRLSHTSTLAEDVRTYTESGDTITNSVLPTTTMMSSVDFKPDLKGPQLVNYVLDMKQREINMEFNEPVSISTVDASGITLYNNEYAYGGENSVNMTQSSYASSGEGIFLTVALSNRDYINLKTAGVAFNTTGFTFLSLASNFIYDVSGNAANGSVQPFDRLIKNGMVVDIKEPSEVIKDTDSPKITAIYMHESIHNMTIYFNDLIEVSTVNLGYFYLTNPSSGAKYSLINAVLVSTNDTSVLEINLFPISVALKTLDIAQGPTTTSLYISTVGAFFDMPFRNPSAAVAASQAINEGQQLTTFRLDLSTNELYLPLSIPVSWGSWEPDRVRIYSLSVLEYFPLTRRETIRFADDNSTLVITLHPITVSDLTTQFLVTDKNTIMLIIDRDAITDGSSKRLGTATSFLVECTQILIDTVAPQVSFFNLDMDLGELQIYFTKPVLTSSVSLAALTLISSTTTPFVSINLENAVLQTGNDVQTSVTITIGSGVYPTLRDQMHLSGSIGVSTSKTLLLIDKGFVSDTTTPPQYMKPVPAINATSVQQLVPDSTPPRVVSWAIDMGARLLTVSFDEAVQHSTNDASFYLLLRDPTEPLAAQRYLLSSQTVLSTGNTITITISGVDINAVNIQERQLCYTAEICYLSIKARSIKDIAPAQNLCAGVLFKFASKALSFVRDKTPPMLLSYEFSLQDGELWMHFDEIIDCHSVDLTKFMWQYANFLGISSQYFVMATSQPDCTAYTGRYTTDIHIVLDYLDLVGIKTTVSLMKTKASTWVSNGADAITDSFDNKFAAMVDGYALNVNVFTADTVRPELISYTITSAKIVVFYFSEPMLATGLKTSEIKFQTSLPPYANSYYIPSATLYRNDLYKMVIEVALNGEYARISGDSVIFTSQSNTFMSIADTAITDTSGNLLIGTPEADAKPLGPSIIAWDLDADTATMRLEFNEQVSNTFNVAGIEVQSDRTRTSSTVVVTLASTGAMTALNAGNTIFETILSQSDLNNLKLFSLVEQKTFANLVVPFGRATSTVSSTLVPFLSTVSITNSASLRIRDLFRDVTPPDIVSFGINFNLGSVNVLFTEPIQNNTFVPTALSMLSSSGASSAVVTSALNVTLESVTTIKISLSTFDLNNLKIAESRGHLDMMVVSYQAAEDFFGNYYLGNTELNPIPESGGVADSVPPTLIKATLNSFDGILLLSFDEVIDIASMQSTYITIASTGDSSGVSFDLTKYTALELLSDGSLSLDMKTFRLDWAAFNAVGGMGSSPSDTYIEYRSVSDVFGNVMVAGSVLQVLEFTADTSPLRLLAFRIEDMTTYYRLELSFSKSVSLTNFNCADVKLMISNSSISDLIQGTTYLDLTDGSTCTLLTSGSFAEIVDVSLPSNFFASTSGYGYVDFTWIIVAAGATSLDASNNLLEPSNPIQRGPRIRDWFIDMNTGLVTLGFTAPIPISGVFNSTNIGFYSPLGHRTGVGIGVSIYLWTSPTVLSPLFGDSPANDVLARFTISATDLNRLKEIDVNAKSIFMLVRDGALYDLLGDSLLTSEPSDAFLPIKFVADNVRPTLLTTTVDLGLGQIELVFDEPIRSTSLKMNQIRIQSSASSLSNSLTLIEGSSTPTSTGNIVILFLSKSDVESLTLRAGLASSASDTYFSFASKTATDYAGNTLPSIASTSARQVTTYIVDSVNPILLSFALDMTLGQLELSFSEAVQVAIMDITGMTLMSRAYSVLGTSFVLTGGTVLDPDGSIVRIQLTESDIYSLKNTAGLVRNSASSFLLVTSAVASDMLGNTVVPIVDTRGMSVKIFTTDLTNPSIVSIDVDVNAETVTFHTSELTWIKYVDVRGAIFQDAQLNPNNTYTLTGNSQVHNPTNLLFTTAVVINIAAIDLDTIKYRKPLLANVAHSWLAVNSKLLTDVYGNPVTSISTSNAKQVTNLAVDITPPALTVFEIDMNNGIINLTWDESILFSSINATVLILQTHERSAFGFSKTLGDSFVASDTDARSNSLTITLSADTKAYLKLYGICRTVYTCYLSWTDRFVTDVFGNYAIPVWDASITGFHPILTNKVYDNSGIHTGYLYIPDTNGPILVNWQLDRISNEIRILFDEPVTIISLGQITIYPSLAMSTVQRLKSGGIVKSFQYSELNRKISAALHDNICIETNRTACVPSAFNAGMMASVGGSYYLSMLDGAVKDMAAITKNNALVPASAAFLVKESTPICSNCPSGQYMMTACTHKSDRVCAPCSSCATGKYTREACSATRDVACEECSSCRMGQYISTQCSGGTDSGCSACSSCTEDQFITRKCENGVNTLCDTCKNCLLTSKYAITICDAKGKYKTWYQANCCFDNDGVKVACRNLDKANMKITARSGRHHWVFPDPEVDMTVYGFGQTY